MANPPFFFPGGKGGSHVVAIEPHSDGDARHWPGKPTYKPISENNYLTNLATAWMKDLGTEQPNINYILDRLPNGFGAFSTQGPSSEYKRLFGHPSGKYYDSIKRFQPHFLWLMSGMEGNCICVLCTGKKPAPIYTRNLEATEIPSRPQSREVALLQSHNSSIRSKSATGLGLASEREKRQFRPAEANVPVDEEGTEDIYKPKIMELSKFRHLKVRDNLKEKYSMDYQAEHSDRKSLSTHFSQISLQHSFIPRVGELVLWCLYFPDELDLVLNPDTGFYQFYSFKQERFLGFPDWHGGVIAAVPSSTTADGPLDFPDLLSNPRKQTGYNTSGFRVETFPDPNNDTDKSLSKQYKYVPLRHIRPLNHWQTLLRGIPERKLNPSIKHALTGMTTISLLEKFRFTADWPSATIHCKGVYLGAELIVVGDTVRILPPIPSNGTTNSEHSHCADVVILSSIRLNLHDITDDHALPQSRQLSTHSSITLLGKAYTLDPRRDYHIRHDLDGNLSITDLTLPEPLPADQVKSTFPTVGAKQYGDWFPLHGPKQKYEVSFDRVLGRMHEADAIGLWTGLSQTRPSSGENPKQPCRPSLSHDLAGVLAGRAYGTQTDERIPATAAGKIAWFWGDTRVQALNVETFNGVEVGAYDLVRDKETLRSWRAMLKVLDGTASVADVAETSLPRRRGRQKGARVVDGKIVYPGEEEESDGTGNEDKVKVRRFSMAGSSQVGLGKTAVGSSQMMRAGLEDSEDASSDDEEMLDANEAGIGPAGSAEEGNRSELSLGQKSGNASEQDREKGKAKHTARKHVYKPDKTPTAWTKAQIMRSVEADNSQSGDEDDDDDDEQDYDEEVLQELTGPIPLARGGTEESEGGDYNPLLEIFQAPIGRRRSSSGPRDKRMRF